MQLVWPKQKQLDNLALEHFLNSWDQFHVFLWQRAHAKFFFFLRGGPHQKKQPKGDWTNPLPSIYQWISQMFYCQLSQVPTAWGFLLVWGTILAIYQCHVAAMDALQCLTKTFTNFQHLCPCFYAIFKLVFELLFVIFGIVTKTGCLAKVDSYIGNICIYRWVCVYSQ